MANQPEVTLYDSGVYQIEATDPVDGGVGAVTNAPLLSLSNRTNYLKKHLDDIENGTFLPDKLAPKDSPVLTGTPTGPTQAVGDSSTKLATDAFVQRAINGSLNVNVAGGVTVTLTQSQYGYPVIALVGALSANIAVVFPSQQGKWQVINNTTGSFTVTLKTAAGTGVVVTQGRSTNILCDATNVNLQQTDFVSPAMTGSPTAPKLQKLSTGAGLITADALIEAGILTSSVRSVPLTATTVTLITADLGAMVSITGSGGGNLVLPAANTCPAGRGFAIRADNSSVSTNTLSCTGTDVIYGAGGNSSNSVVLSSNDCIVLISNGSGWLTMAESLYTLRAGRLVGVQSFTANGTYTPTPGTRAVIVEVQGGGGGGGGAGATASGAVSIGGGGGGGGYVKGRLLSGFSGAAVVVGGGGGGGAGVASGFNGNASSFGGTLTASGGGGGPSLNPTTSYPVQTAGGNPGSGSGGSLLNSMGGAGLSALATSPGNGISGTGGPSAMSQGGARAIGNSAGLSGVYGSGGSGAISQLSASNFSGGGGGNGIVIVWEYS